MIQIPASEADPTQTPVSTDTTSHEEALEDGTRVVHTTTIQTFPDGTQCKKTITRRIDVAKVEEENVGRPEVTLSLRNFKLCCCCIPLRKKDKDETKGGEEQEGGDE